MRYKRTLVALALLLPTSAAAQTNATKPPVSHDQVVSANPFGLIFKWANGEYERKVSPSVTLGGSASYFADRDFVNDGGIGMGTALVRWYPQGAALDGFYIGGRLSAIRFKTRVYQYEPYPPNQPNPRRPTYDERTRVVPGAGVEIGYNWLLGAKQNFSVGVGVGLTRMIGNGGGYDFPDVLPTLRLINLGVAF